MSDKNANEPKQLLHLVFGGELTDLEGVEFKDLDKLDVVGIFPDYASARLPGRVPPSAQSTTPTCAISSCICTGYWIRIPTRQVNRCSWMPSLKY